MSVGKIIMRRTVNVDLVLLVVRPARLVKIVYFVHPAMLSPITVSVWNVTFPAKLANQIDV